MMSGPCDGPEEWGWKPRLASGRFWQFPDPWRNPSQDLIPIPTHNVPDLREQLALLPGWRRQTASAAWRGRVTMHTRGEAPASHYARQAVGALLGESGF